MKHKPIFIDGKHKKFYKSHKHLFKNDKDKTCDKRLRSFIYLMGSTKKCREYYAEIFDQDEKRLLYGAEKFSARLSPVDLAFMRLAVDLYHIGPLMEENSPLNRVEIYSKYSPCNIFCTLLQYGLCPYAVQALLLWYS
ncbi:DUF6075 family protein [Oribacterium sp. WCC10]|uniref:DUF6075 family protein n=1 Tax=Oribacterium sp. WCC10 TaxID=1855343 RepID=UPI0008EE8D8E|nr:DUF6075 family protein [Oribacterium sp. WCC10]SFG30938.1 hypothetical protein SAMN05216356_105104 [Oribacterium sp. WCC10]